MMRVLSKLFLRGIFTLLPFGLTAVILISFLRWTERLTGELFSMFASDIYFPGLGLIIGVVFILTLGLVTTMPFMVQVIRFIELPFKNVPILNSVYNAVKSLSDYFSPESKNADQQVVLVKFPGFDAELLGLVTRRNLNDMPAQFTKGERVAVFLPLSYQVGGLTVFIPREYIRRIDMKVEMAMRSTLTAWMPGQEASPSDSDF
jgi:uncharacterized membrane protein